MQTFMHAPASGRRRARSKAALRWRSRQRLRRRKELHPDGQFFPSCLAFLAPGHLQYQLVLVCADRLQPKPAMEGGRIECGLYLINIEHGGAHAGVCSRIGRRKDTTASTNKSLQSPATICLAPATSVKCALGAKERNAATESSVTSSLIRPRMR